MAVDFKSINISTEEASSIVSDLFNIEGDISKLPGDSEFNFKITTRDET